ncbi:MAG: hypothetical protein EAZ92_02190 [Candidatus Kapaibacterium sp.]|nr:MAG: hypothetical protein EAZ92_02190 [Candidatus Kapabacteria bacterium]
MNKILFNLTLAFLCGLHGIIIAQKPLWQVSLQDNIRRVSYLDNNSKVFVLANRSMRLYDQVSGQKLWEIPLLENKQFLLGTSIGAEFISSNKCFIVKDAGLTCYDILTGKVIDSTTAGLYGLEKRYLSTIDTTTDGFLRLKYSHPLPSQLIKQEITVLINQSFREVSRSYKLSSPKGYDSILIDNTLRETKRIFVAQEPMPSDTSAAARARERIDAVKQGKYIRFNTKEKVLEICSLTTNEVLASLPNTEAQRATGFLGTIPIQWASLTTSDERFAVVILEKKQVIVIDMTTNKEVGRFLFDVSASERRIFAYNNAFLVLGNNNSTLHIALPTLKTTTIPLTLAPSSTATYSAAGREVTIFFSTENLGSLSNFYSKTEIITAAIDMASGELLWKNPVEKPSIDIIIEVIGFDGTNLRLLTKKSQNDLFNPRQFGYVQSIDILKGTTVYQTKIAEARSGQYYSLLMNAKKYGDNDVIIIRGNAEETINPQTQQVGGEGICVLDSKTGAVVASDYSQLDAKLFYSDNDVFYLVGRPNTLAFNIKSNKRHWLLTPTAPFPQDINPINYIVKEGVMYLYHFGSKKARIGYSAFDAPDPCGFYAIDLKEGKLAWNAPIEEAEAPEKAMTTFSLEENYNPATKTLFYATSKKLYALQCQVDGGKYAWLQDLQKTPIQEIKREFYEPVIELGAGNDGNQKIVRERGTDGKYYDTYLWIGGREWFKKFPPLWNDAGRDTFVKEFSRNGLLTGLPTWYGTWSERITRVDYTPERILVIGNKGLGCFDPTTGGMRWAREWAHSNIQYFPRIIGSALVYMAEQKFVAIDIASGEVLAQDSFEGDNVDFSVAPDKKSIIGTRADVMKVYRLTK